MPGTICLERDRLYSEPVVCQLLGVRPPTLAEARESGSLRWSKVGRRRLYRGDWLMAWIERSAGEREAVAC